MFFFLIGGIFYNWGQLGANVKVEYEFVFKSGAFYALVEFENMFLIGGILFQFGGNWGQIC